MSYRCEHNKDSDTCVQCWEETNLEPRIMNEPTPLQKAVERTYSYLNEGRQPHPLDIQELLTAAKQLEALQAEHDAMRIDFESLTIRSNQFLSERNVLQKENKELRLKLVNRNSWAREVQQAAKVIEQGRDSLKLALKECVEALKCSVQFCDDTNCEFGKPHHPNCAVAKNDKIFSNPLVKQFLEDK